MKNILKLMNAKKPHPLSIADIAAACKLWFEFIL